MQLIYMIFTVQFLTKQYFCKLTFPILHKVYLVTKICIFKPNIILLNTYMYYDFFHDLYKKILMLKNVQQHFKLQNYYFIFIHVTKSSTKLRFYLLQTLMKIIIVSFVKSITYYYCKHCILPNYILCIYCLCQFP